MTFQLITACPDVVWVSSDTLFYDTRGAKNPGGRARNVEEGSALFWGDNGNPVDTSRIGGFVDKILPLPRFNMVVMGTGSMPFILAWHHYILCNLGGARDAETLNAAAPMHLDKLASDFIANGWFMPSRIIHAGVADGATFVDIFESESGWERQFHGSNRGHFHQPPPDFKGLHGDSIRETWNSAAMNVGALEFHRKFAQNVVSSCNAGRCQDQQAFGGSLITACISGQGIGLHAPFAL